MAWRMRTVEQHRCPGCGDVEGVDAFEQIELMNGNEVCLADEVGRLDGAWRDPDVGHGARARLLGVVDEIALGVEGVVSPMILTVFLFAPTVPSEPIP